MNSISNILKNRRLALGMTLAQVARKSDTSVSALSRYENGWHRFELATLEKLAAALGCELSIKLDPLENTILQDRKSAEEVIRQIGRLFWDRKPRPDDLSRYSRWVLERVLEFGNLTDVRALIGHYGRDGFLELVSTCRFSSRRTRVFWENILKRENPECTKKHCPGAAENFWTS
jgi:transcriptional regulator with XRE-family HTH domain